MEFTKSQLEAIKGIERWYAESGKQIFIVAGWAGTGKTSIVKAATEGLGIGAGGVVFCTYTGKAALVLQRKGNLASTIHRLIYDVDARETYFSKKTGEEVSLDEYSREPSAHRVRKKLSFQRKMVLDPAIKLIVVDEVSMVGKELLTDLASYGRPILCLGDQGLETGSGDKPL